MKQLFVVMCVMLILALSGTALAGEIKPAIYVGGGMAIPMSPQLFSDNWKIGFGGTGSVGFEISPVIEIGGTFAYNSNSFDEDKFLESIILPPGARVDITGAKFKAMEFLGYGKYTFATGESPFKPYLKASAGVAKLSRDLTTLVADTSGVEIARETIPEVAVTDFTLGFGAGVAYMFSPTAGVWLDAQYLVIMTEGESTAYLPLRAGLKFMFGGK